MGARGCRRYAAKAQEYATEVQEYAAEADEYAAKVHISTRVCSSGTKVSKLGIYKQITCTRIEHKAEHKYATEGHKSAAESQEYESSVQQCTSGVSKHKGMHPTRKGK